MATPTPTPTYRVAFQWATNTMTAASLAAGDIKAATWTGEIPYTVVDGSALYVTSGAYVNGIFGLPMPASEDSTTELYIADNVARLPPGARYRLLFLNAGAGNFLITLPPVTLLVSQSFGSISTDTRGCIFEQVLPASPETNVRIACTSSCQAGDYIEITALTYDTYRINVATAQPAAVFIPAPDG